MLSNLYDPISFLSELMSWPNKLVLVNRKPKDFFNKVVCCDFIFFGIFKSIL